MPDEYYDDGYEEKEPIKDKKIKSTNPAGPYHFEILFRGIKYDVTIKNITYKKFKVEAYTETDDENFDYESHILSLNKYLEDEGYFMAAKKHNLYYK
jgi:hypothetical protein